MALFGEKYGERVRVVSVLDELPGGGFDSVELCGGTHCDRTGQIGMMKIVSDGAIAAGVRRITAVTGRGAFTAIREKFERVREVSGLLKVRDDELPARVSALLDERSRLEKEIARIKKADAVASVDAILAAGKELAGVTLYVHRAEGLGPDELRTITDKVSEDRDDRVVVLAGIGDGRISLVCKSGKEAVKRGVKAGDVCRELGKALGGGGGGRPEMAQGQGRDVARLDEVLSEVVGSLEAKLAG